MRNWTLFHVWGIPIRVNITLLVFLPALAYLISREATIGAYIDLLEAIGPHTFDLAALTDGTMPWLIGFGAAFGLFVGVTLHELGHSWMAMRYEIGITSITLWIFGGLARLEDIPEDWNIEFNIAIAGPVTSVLVGVFVYVVYLVLPNVSDPLLFVIGFVAMINIVLAVFNMLPAFPMDGGRIFRALLARNRPWVEATRTAATVGKGFAIAMALLGLLAFAPLLILVAMFVYIAAGAESRVTVLRDLFRGITVAEVMRPIDDPPSREMTVQEGLETMMTRRVTGFPIIGADEEYVGFVSLRQIQGVEAGDRGTKSLGDIARTDLPILSPDMDAFEVLQVFAEHRTDRLPVVEDGRLAGVISNQNFVEAIEVFQGLRTASSDLLPGKGYP